MPIPEPDTDNPSNYLDLSSLDQGGGFRLNLFWSPKEPSRIHLISADPRFVNDAGTGSGLRIQFSSNPKSADYNPNNFNRCARVLKAWGRPAPEEVDVHPRTLRTRDKLIKALSGASAPTSAPAIPTDTDHEATICLRCWCWVANIDNHLLAAH